MSYLQQNYLGRWSCATGTVGGLEIPHLGMPDLFALKKLLGFISCLPHYNRQNEVALYKARRAQGLGEIGSEVMSV